MKIYTRRGDAGETDLFGGGRVAKDDLRVTAYGDVDELNSCVGVAATSSQLPDLLELTRVIQSQLFDLGSELATPDAAHRQKASVPHVDEAAVVALEAAIDRLEADLPALTSFILPGGTSAAAGFHHARAVCRRAERRVVALDREQALESWALRYLNRLSDLLFVMARVENHRAGVADVEWVGRSR